MEVKGQEFVGGMLEVAGTAVSRCSSSVDQRRQSNARFHTRLRFTFTHTHFFIQLVFTQSSQKKI